MEQKDKNIALITGATGYIGSNLSRCLANMGWDVHLLIRPCSKKNLIKDILNVVILHEFDGSTSNMIKILNDANPTIVFHLASLFLAQHKSDDIESLIQSNITFSTQLVEAMVLNKIYYLINTGTSWQHYENCSYNPVCLYAATKQAAEDIFTFYVETTALKIVTLKLFDTFGPNDPRNKLIPLLRKIAKQNVSLDMSPGEQLIDIVYIDDVINAFLIAAKKLINGDISEGNYAISSGTPIKLKELVEIYESVIKQNLSINWGDKPYRNREVMVPWNTGESLPGWIPNVSLEEGLRRL